MPQIVGKSCFQCGTRISSVTDAEFCECGNVVHSACKTPAKGEEACNACGGDLQSEQAKNYFRDLEDLSRISKNHNSSASFLSNVSRLTFAGWLAAIVAVVPAIFLPLELSKMIPDKAITPMWEVNLVLHVCFLVAVAVVIMCIVYTVLTTIMQIFRIAIVNARSTDK